MSCENLFSTTPYHGVAQRVLFPHQRRAPIGSGASWDEEQSLRKLELSARFAQVETVSKVCASFKLISKAKVAQIGPESKVRNLTLKA